MTIIEDLGPFVRFGNFIGLFPYRLEADPSRLGMKRFVFSWCHLLTFWCIFLLIFEIGLIIFLTQFNNAQLIQHISHTSSVVSLITSMAAKNQIVMILIVRAMTFRYHRLQSAVKSLIILGFTALEETEELLSCRNTFKKRALIGISLIIASVG